MSAPQVCIIILNWNGLQDTTECLESLRQITYTSYAVVVVDNGSKGDDVAVLRQKFGDYICVIENNRNYGFAEGCNIGMQYALASFEPDYILLLNNDTVVDRGFLSELVSVAESEPSVGIAGPKVYLHNEPDRVQSAGGRINWWTGQATIRGWSETDSGQFDEIAEVDWVTGCAMLVKRRVISDVGLLYAPYFMYFEETDWCARCRKAGYRIVYVPGAKLWHKRHLDAGKMESLPLYYWTRNRFLFMKRNATKPQLVSFLLHFFFREALAPVTLSVRQRAPGLFWSYCKGTFAGVSLMLRKEIADAW